MIDLKSQTLEEMTATLKNMGEPSFRGKQIFTWLHKGVTSFDEMSNLSKPLREKLKEQCYITAPVVARKQVSRLDGTIKYLWELMDGNCIETVVMQYHHGNTVCVSSQVGCRMGCAFCASTIAGKVRDLTPSEILDQVIFAQKDSGLPISNIVLMGIGEPLDNLDNVLRFLELVNHPDGLNIGMRHISLSTCGVIPGIERLAELELQLTLSVSLHAPDSETRSPIYNDNGKIEIMNNRFIAYHLGFDGQPSERFGYRALVTYQKGWGTYSEPFTKKHHNVSFLFEGNYRFNHGWAMKGGYGMDFGSNQMLGHNAGFQLTISKNGMMGKKKTSLKRGF